MTAHTSRGPSPRTGYLWTFALVATATLLILSASTRAAIVEGNIQTSIRPIVSLQYSNTDLSSGATFAQRTAVGIFDSGDPTDTLSRETASVLGLYPITPTTPSAAIPAAERFNTGTVLANTVTSGGWLGAAWNSPERTSVLFPGVIDRQVRAGDPAHLFNSTATLGNAQPSFSPGVHPTYFDYNQQFSENHTGMAYVTTTNPANNQVVFVDPLNGTPLPFAYANVTAGNGRGLKPASAVDALSSSVSYFTAGGTRTPTPAKNTNPGFVTFIPLEPREYDSPGSTAATTLTPLAAAVAVNGALPVGVDRRITITVANAAGANVARLIPEEDQGTSQSPGYIPAQNDGTAIAVVGAPTFEVRNAAIAIGGTTNPNGFVRTDGAVEIVVRQADGTVRLIQHVILPTQAPRPYGTINIPELGINTGAAAKLIDTGAPTDGNTNAIIGTTTLNRFGQYFDFSPMGGGGATDKYGRLTLIGPTAKRVRDLRDNGITFNVDGGTTGLSRTAVNQEKTFGAIPQLQPGTTTMTIAGAAPDEAKSTFFRTLLTGSNASFIDELATGVARAGDTIDAQSMGADAIVKSSKLFFSVDRLSMGQQVGQPGSDARIQANRNQVRADIFEIPGGQATPTDRAAGLGNSLFVNQEVMGLGPNYGPLVNAVNDANNPNDNLLDFDLDTSAAMVATGMSNLDSPIIRTNDDGNVDRARVGGDRYETNFDMYFSLTGSADIFRSKTTNTFANGVIDIGLDVDDDLDALSLFRPSVMQGVIGGALDPGAAIGMNLLDGRFDPNAMGEFDGIDAFQGLGATDLALFSLTPGSASLAAFGLSPADIFVTDFDGTFSLFGTAESLGLLFGDNVDGLDSLVPEPAASVLLGVAVAALAGLRRRGAA